MRKLIIILIVMFTLFISCKRDEVVEPPISGPSTLSYILEGSANPTTLRIAPNPDSSLIRVRLYDFTGKPISGAPIFFETIWTYTLIKQTYDKYGTLTKEETSTGGGRADLGNFYGSFTYLAPTDSNGFVNIIYTAPDSEEFNSRTVWSYSYGPPDNPSTDVYIISISSFYIKAHWTSPPNSNMNIFCYIPINFEVAP